ncbi:HD-GYP domain-containing protein [Paenibacillus apiarius]|nr:HD-GYP domain-containing protein [Paenibacillus apiarius]
MVKYNVRVHVTQIRDGDRLSKDIFNHHGLLVLSAGTAIKERDIALFLRHHMDMIDIETREDNTFMIPLTSVMDKGLDEDSHSDMPDQTSHSRPSMLHYYKEALSGVETLFSDAVAHGFVKDKEVEQTIVPVIQQIENERDVVSLLLMLDSQDDYTCQHSVQVGMLAFYLAKWLHYDEEDALRICKAGFLHDIGKAHIDSAILNKPGRLTAEEFEAMKRHTIAGYEIIRQSYEDEWLSLAALQHHERLDGSGYPYGLMDENIHPVSRIVAIVDIYSAMTSNRSYRKKQDLFTVLKELYHMSFSGLDPTITHTFIRNMLPNFIHKQARLSDGRTGLIVMTHQTEFFRPLVQIDDQFIDLSLTRELCIEQVYV